MLESLKKKNLLIIDDQPVIGLILKKKLGDLYNVTVKYNGAEALSSILSGNHPDLVVVDLHMPEMNGIEFIREVRKICVFKDLPLLVLSAESSEESISSALDSGANEYLLKPLDPTELNLRLQSYF
jgi:CheY-like chemotaxis protein